MMQAMTLDKTVYYRIRNSFNDASNDIRQDCILQNKELL